MWTLILEIKSAQGMGLDEKMSLVTPLGGCIFGKSDKVLRNIYFFQLLNSATSNMVEMPRKQH